jgi:hypothetical protein
MNYVDTSLFCTLGRLFPVYRKKITKTIKIVRYETDNIKIIIYFKISKHYYYTYIRV